MFLQLHMLGNVLSLDRRKLKHETLFNLDQQPLLPADHAATGWVTGMPPGASHRKQVTHLDPAPGDQLHQQVPMQVLRESVEYDQEVGWAPKPLPTKLNRAPDSRDPLPYPFYQQQPHPSVYQQHPAANQLSQQPPGQVPHVLHPQHGGYEGYGTIPPQQVSVSTCYNSQLLG